MKILTGLMLTMFACIAVAQDPVHLDVRTIVQKEEIVVNAAGDTETKLVTAETVAPGESVFYTITFTNVSDEVADNVVITNPIASELTYIDGSAFGPGMDILFSVDGGQTFAAAGELKVTEDGQERVATASDFTHVRWIMQNDLQAGAQGIARFAAVLN
ncbi:MAG: DUF11 domain-containing protein [Proteobacteria bacterium]|nr:DUF11 domain-containing protein [Pseudomonadota bacterium]